MGYIYIGEDHRKSKRDMDEENRDINPSLCKVLTEYEYSQDRYTGSLNPTQFMFQLYQQTHRCKVRLELGRGGAWKRNPPKLLDHFIIYQADRVGFNYKQLCPLLKFLSLSSFLSFLGSLFSFSTCISTNPTL